MAGLRVLVDPCLAPSFGVQGLLSETTPAPTAGSVGRVDVVCVTSGEPGSFDSDTVAALDVHDARFLVPDDRVRKRLGRLGLSRVRVVRPGDVVPIGPLSFTVSPGRAPLGLLPGSVGFHVDDGVAALWHTGNIAPLEVDARATSFAADHPARVVCAGSSGLGLRSSNPPLLADLDDAMTLARLARARTMMPVARGARPAGLFSLILTMAGPPAPSTTTAPHAGRHHRVEVVEPQPGTWYRFGA